jgi:glycerophosphoryl diester phosphodiesterase
MHVWVVNTAAQAESLWRKGVHGLLSDDPATILAARTRLMDQGTAIARSAMG